MDPITKARELGKEIQADERYVNYMAAKAASDEDEALQEMINEFNLKRADLNNEITKTERDEERMATLDGEIRELYAKIMTNEHMAGYAAAKEALDALVNQISTLIMMTVNGEDPETLDVNHSCTGSCSTCGGCH